MATTPNDVRTQLTGPGGAFEVGIELIDGIDTKMYRQRFGSLREVAAMAGAYGDREALVFGDQRFTYGQVIAWANRVANGLVEHHDIKRGDRVAVLAANCPEWAVSFWGSVSVGGGCVAACATESSSRFPVWLC